MRTTKDSRKNLHEDIQEYAAGILAHEVCNVIEDLADALEVVECARRATEGERLVPHSRFEALKESLARLGAPKVKP